MAKPSALVMQIRRALEQEHIVGLAISQEIDTIAMMMMCADDLQVGPGRAKKCLDDFRKIRMEIAQRVVEDGKEDNEILVIKRDLAARLKDIFGPSWEEVRECFPMLKYYW